MALVQMQFESKFLSIDTHVDIIIPDKPRPVTPEEYYDRNKKFKVLFLLHGTYGSESSWVRKSLIEIYALERNCMVVMPSGLNTEFLNWADFSTGYYVEDYLVKELIPMVHAWFPASEKREDNYIAGLSMGSYAAFHIAMEHPELFAGAICLSGVPKDWGKDRKRLEDIEKMDVLKLAEASMARKGDLNDEFLNLRIHNNLKQAGGIDAYIENSDWKKIEKKDPKTLPDFFFAVGDKDPLFYEASQDFEEKLKKLGVKATFCYDEGYGHVWRFWNKWIEKGMDHFAMGGKKA